MNRIVRLAWMIKNRRWKDLRWAFKSRVLRRPTSRPHDWLLDRPADIFIVGAPKCGTSSLHAYLAEHPAIHATDKKEHQYYGQTVDAILKRGLRGKAKRLKDKYQEDLDGGQRGQLRVESTPNYLDHKDAAARIFLQNPNAKIIVLTRDYADRLRSNFLMWKRVGFDQRSFDEFQREGMGFWERGVSYGHPYIQLGEYAEATERFARLFPPVNIFIGCLEDMAENPFSFMYSISKFLGIDPEPFRTIEYRVHNAIWRQIPADWVPGARDAIWKYYARDYAHLKSLGGEVRRRG